MPTRLSIVVTARPDGGFSIDWAKPTHLSGIIQETDPKKAEEFLKWETAAEYMICVGLRRRLERMLAMEEQLARKAIDAESVEVGDAERADSKGDDKAGAEREVDGSGGDVAPQHGRQDGDKDDGASDRGTVLVFPTNPSGEDPIHSG